MAAIPKAEWKSLSDRGSKTPEGKPAEIEVASLKLGDQIQAEWTALIGVSYDPKDDLIEVALEGLDHLIHHPRELHVEEGPQGVVSLAVLDEDENRHIVRFKDPLMLQSSRG
jgi:hypothetical protein